MMLRQSLVKLYGLSAFAVAIALFGANPQQVLAEEYSMEITPEMQQNGTDGLTDGDESSTDSTSRVTIASNLIYDSQLGTYLYSVTDGYIYANVLDTMMTQSEVEISADTGIEYTVYKNGEALEQAESMTITETGSYTVMTTRSTKETEVFSFTLIGDAIREPLSYALPSTCAITSVTIDGVQAEASDRSVDLSQEGHYEIAYLCVRNNVDYNLSFDVDHTAPTLTIKGLNNNKARGKVTLTDVEAGASVSITKDGNTIKAKSELTQPGSYTVKITDAAGNSTAYSFYILFYLNAGGITFGLVTIAAIVALGIYLYTARKRMRVR